MEIFPSKSRFLRSIFCPRSLLEWEELLKKSKPKNLANDMMTDILTRLPVKSIIRFKSACKLWLNFLDEPRFRQMQLNKAISSGKDCLLLRHPYARMMPRRGIERIFSRDLLSGGFDEHYHREVYSFRSKHNFEELGKIREPISTHNLIVGSVNGIVCLINEDDDPSNSLERITLWNPATRELKVLPRPSVQRSNACKTIGVGFAFVQSSNEYKVAVILKVSGTTFFNVMVYSLSTDCWNDRGMLVTSQFRDPVSKVYVNGRLHWLNCVTSTREHSILCFDTNEETFSTLELPVVSVRANRVNILAAPQSLGESLVALTSSYNQGCSLWFMREYGNRESWTKLYSIPQWIALKMEPVGWLDQGELISVIHENNLLISYNLVDQKVKNLHASVTTPACYGTYIQSLVSLGGTKPLPNLQRAFSSTSKVNHGMRISRQKTIWIR